MVELYLEQTREIESRKTIGYREMTVYIYKLKSARAILVRVDEQLSNVNFFVFFTEIFEEAIGNAKLAYLFLAIRNILRAIVGTFIINNFKYVPMVQRGLMMQGMCIFDIL